MPPKRHSTSTGSPVARFALIEIAKATFAENKASAPAPERRRKYQLLDLAQRQTGNPTNNKVPPTIAIRLPKDVTRQPANTRQYKR